MSGTAKSNKSKRLIGRVVGIASLAIFLIVVGAYMLLTKMLRDDIARLPTDLERAHKLGLPLDQKEFEALKPKIPDSENAAPFYKKVFAELQRQHIEEIQRSSTSSAKNGSPATLPSPEEDFDAIKSNVLEAIRRPYYDFEIDWKNGISLPQGVHIVTFLEAPYWGLFSTIEADAEDKQSRKDFQGELDDLDIQISITRQASEYLSVYGGEALEDAKQVVLQKLFGIVQERWQDEQILDRAEKLAKRIQLPDLYKRMEANFVLGREAIKRIDSMQQIGIGGSPIAQINKAGDEIVKTLDVKDAFDAKYVRMYVDLFESLPKDRTDLIGIYRAIVNANKKIAKDKSPGGYVNRTLKPGFEGEPITFARILARQKLLLTAINVFRDRARLGKFPATLSQNDPSWVDPVAKTPIHYRPQAEGFTLSFGRHDLSDKPLLRTEVFQDSNWDSAYQYTEHPRKPGPEYITWIGKFIHQLTPDDR